VESAFTVADYQIVVLSAEESSDLFGWPGNNGYALPEGGNNILQNYIDSGTYFMAVKVLTDSAPGERLWLPPLQFSYSSEAMTLPIRIGTISADGAQEVVIYTITPSSSVGISNYPQIAVEDECMFKGSLNDHYAAAVEKATATSAGWILEHSWDMGQACDPCTGTDPFTVDEMAQLGFGSADTGHYGSYLGHLTRLRVRYTPEQATQDLVLYEVGDSAAMEQTRYIRYKEELEFLYPVCDEGFVDTPGECPQLTSCQVQRHSGLGAGLVDGGFKQLSGATEAYMNVSFLAASLYLPVSLPEPIDALYASPILPFQLGAGVEAGILKLDSGYLTLSASTEVWHRSFDTSIPLTAFHIEQHLDLGWRFDTCTMLQKAGPPCLWWNVRMGPRLWHLGITSWEDIMAFGFGADTGLGLELGKKRKTSIGMTVGTSLGFGEWMGELDLPGDEDLRWYWVAGGLRAQFSVGRIF
jgi:hypothetical protein